MELGGHGGKCSAPHLGSCLWLGLDITGIAHFTKLMK